MILILILNRSLEKYWYWLGRMNQYQDILILILILYKALDEYWYCLVNHNQYQGILILFIGLESQFCPSLLPSSDLDIDTILTRSWQYQDFLILLLILILSKSWEEYWYWLSRGNQYQDFLTLILMFNKEFRKYWFWYWYWVRNWWNIDLGIDIE